MVLFRILFLLVCLAPFTSNALSVPERPSGYINDAAQMLSPDAKSRLEQALAQFEQKTSNQIIVATFLSLEDESLEDFSIRLAEKWMIGQKEKDNGVILLIFKNDRKLRIEVGYGLEGVLPDATAGQIINTIITPEFKKGDFDRGIMMGVASIIQATEGEYQATQKNNGGQLPEIEARQEAFKSLALFSLFLVFIFFIIDFIRYKKYAGDHKNYKGRYSFWEWWFRFAILLFVLNLLFRMVFYTILFSRGGSYGSRSGFGGFSGGGGGKFGGGGSSGSW